MKEIDSVVLDFIKDKHKERRVIVSFSFGKDSLCVALALKKANIPFEMIHHYIVPNFSMTDKYASFYEDFFGQEIHLLPHPICLQYMYHGIYQDLPASSYLTPYDQLIPKNKWSFTDIQAYYINSTREVYGDKKPIEIVGLRSGDSFNRAMLIKNRGIIDEQRAKVYPIHHWGVRDCFDYIRAAKCKLPKFDYANFFCSFDGVRYNFLNPLKEKKTRNI